MSILQTVWTSSEVRQRADLDCVYRSRPIGGLELVRGVERNLYKAF